MKKWVALACTTFWFCAAMGTEVPQFAPALPPKELVTGGGIHFGGRPSLNELWRKDFSNLAWVENRAAWEILLSEGHWLSSAGLPKLPAVTRRFPLKPGKTAKVSISEASFEKSLTSVALVNAEPGLRWGTELPLSGQELGERFYPPSPISVQIRKEAVWVTLYPIVWDRKENRLWHLKSVKVSLEEAPSPKETSVLDEGGTESLIVTTRALEAAARRLQDFHRERLHLTTEIRTLESLAHEPPLSESELPNGYRDRASTDTGVLPFDSKTGGGYDYETSRKLQTYLHRRLQSSQPLRYLTLLGDAHAVPPSYYFWISSVFIKKFGVTDQCYGALSQCTDFRAAVGRLPLSSEEEVVQYLKKVDRWLSFSPKSRSELSLAGGKAFPQSNVFVGELANLNLLESPHSDWVGIQKFFRTRQNYSRESILGLLRGNSPSSFLYWVDHGEGNRMRIEKEFVSASDFADPQLGLFSGARVPLVVSVACSAAAFDSSLLRESILGPVRYGIESLGEALVRSPLGAVAYLGATRDSMGSPDYRIDPQGNLRLRGTDFFLRLLESVLETYRLRRQGRIGDFLVDSLKKYSAETAGDALPDLHRWTLWTLELLGDPVLPLPRREKTQENFAPPLSETHFDGVGGKGYPKWIHATGQAHTLRLNIESPVQTNFMRIGELGTQNMTDQWLGKNTLLPSDNFDVSAEEAREGAYFLSLENKKGVPRERQVWFRLQLQP